MPVYIMCGELRFSLPNLGVLLSFGKKNLFICSIFCSYLHKFFHKVQSLDSMYQTAEIRHKLTKDKIK